MTTQQHLKQPPHDTAMATPWHPQHVIVTVILIMTNSAATETTPGRGPAPTPHRADVDRGNASPTGNYFVSEPRWSLSRPRGAVTGRRRCARLRDPRDDWRPVCVARRLREKAGIPSTSSRLGGESTEDPPSATSQRTRVPTLRLSSPQRPRLLLGDSDLRPPPPPPPASTRRPPSPAAVGLRLAGTALVGEMVQELSFRV